MSVELDRLKEITSGDALFTGVADSTLESWIDATRREVSAITFGSHRTEAVAYLAAHKYAAGPGANSVSGLGGLGGAAAERRAGKWAIRYQPPSSGGASASDSVLAETSYGREFLRIRGIVAGFPRIALPGV